MHRLRQRVRVDARRLWRAGSLLFGAGLVLLGPGTLAAVALAGLGPQERAQRLIYGGVGFGAAVLSGSVLVIGGLLLRTLAGYVEVRLGGPEEPSFVMSYPTPEAEVVRPGRAAAPGPGTEPVINLTTGASGRHPAGGARSLSGSGLRPPSRP